MVSLSVMGQEKKKSTDRILFILDASHSMQGEWKSGSKIDIAKKLLINLLDSLAEYKDLEIGLRIYGNKSHYQMKDCEDTHLEVDFLKPDSAIKLITAKLSLIKAQGTTPIARSLELGATNDFLLYDSDSSRNVVILITDGKESCNMDPCAVSRLYQRKGIILKPFIVGVGLFDESWKDSFDCVGRFFDASTEEAFAEVLQLIISHVIDNTTAQVDLLDENGNATETDINLTFYDEFTGMAKYNYVHNLRILGDYKYPDTMIIDPVFSYKVIAHTIPPVSVENVIIKPGRHTTIPLRTPQGTLKITMNTKQNYPCIIRDSGSRKTVHIQKVNSSEKYLVGIYDLEVLSLPRKIYTNIKIEQGLEYPLQIPPTGLINIKLPSKGYGGLYVKNNDQLEQIYHFKGEKTEHKLELLPGSYKVVYSSKSSKRYIYTKEKEFKIKSGESKLLKIY